MFPPVSTFSGQVHFSFALHPHPPILYFRAFPHPSKKLAPNRRCPFVMAREPPTISRGRPAPVFDNRATGEDAPDCKRRSKNRSGYPPPTRFRNRSGRPPRTSRSATGAVLDPGRPHGIAVAANRSSARLHKTAFECTARPKAA